MTKPWKPERFSPFAVAELLRRCPFATEHISVLDFKILIKNPIPLIPPTQVGGRKNKKESRPVGTLKHPWNIHLVVIDDLTH
jgi:hypothetical protein